MDGRRFHSRLEGFQEMSTDPCLDAALDYYRRTQHPSLLVRFWNWYKKVTGYEKAMLQRRTGLRIRSTCHLVKEPQRRDLLSELVQSKGAR